MHQRIVESVADIALTVAPDPRRVLDVGCGTGAMLRLLASRLTDAEALVGIDPAPSMLRTAAATVYLDPRLSFRDGAAEDLPFPDDDFDLLVSTTSFDHWASQPRGLAQCVRVLRPGAPLVLCDLFSPLLVPTQWLGHRGKARTRTRVSALLHYGRVLVVDVAPVFSDQDRGRNLRPQATSRGRNHLRRHSVSRCCARASAPEQIPYAPPGRRVSHRCVLRTVRDRAEVRTRGSITA
ncbi:MAG: class I SAM-dependent methyltransferase [Jatrophihabitans sp.]